MRVLALLLLALAVSHRHGAERNCGRRPTLSPS